MVEVTVVEVTALGVVLAESDERGPVDGAEGPVRPTRRASRPRTGIGRTRDPGASPGARADGAGV
ncbi:hypothetical protein SAMN05428996_2096 [Quadrisphaera sp. DSM 44207]|nr:hypothetical protein SAMN05428996_2096 [Quadrisphaera sp. DSM 44207]